MTRLLLAVFLLLPAVLWAQDTTTCSQLTIDLDGDLQIGAGDILMLLGGYGTNLDVDGDMIPDCQDYCVGAYDSCGVCNGPGPQVLAIDTIIITYDSIYAEAIDDWLIFELSRDTLLHLVCENPGCNDPLADNFSPYAEEGGLCLYLSCFGPTFDYYTYQAVEIGNQCWFAENLRTTIYANGDSIPDELSSADWSTTTDGASAVFGEGDIGCNDDSPAFIACNDDAQSLAVYGRLYNGFAVNDERGLCPSGWHVPASEEWAELAGYLTDAGYEGAAGDALKGTSGWASDGNGSDTFGFNGLPGGGRYESGGFNVAGLLGSWWSSTMTNNGSQRIRMSMLYNSSTMTVNTAELMRVGFSIRCLRDAE